MIEGKKMENDKRDKITVSSCPMSNSILQKMKVKYLNTSGDSWVTRRFIHTQERPQRCLFLREWLRKLEKIWTQRTQSGNSKR